MATDLIEIDPDQPQPEAIERAAACIRRGGVVAEPVPEAWGEAEAAEPALAEGMNGKGQVGEEGRGGRILAEDFNVDADFGIGAGQLADRLRRPAIGGREATNDVENPHTGRLQAVPV